MKWGEVHDERIVLFLGWTIPLSFFDASKSNNLTIYISVWAQWSLLNALSILQNSLKDTVLSNEKYFC